MPNHSPFAALRGALAVVLLNLTALAGIVWQLRDPRATAVRIEPAPSPTPAPTATPVRLQVYVSGAVKHSAVVTLSEGARARDAVAAAGGFAETADPVAINLAAPLADGMQLQVPAKGELVQAGTGAASSGAGKPALAAGTGSGASRLAAGSPLLGAVGGPSGSAAGGLINLNTANATELDVLPGVGPALAARIVAYRTEHGQFAQVEDLLNVSGIGEKTLERFKAEVGVR